MLQIDSRRAVEQTRAHSATVPLPSSACPEGLILATKKRRVPSQRSYADRADVEKFAHGLKDSHLQCRELGHNWRPFTAALNTVEHYYERVLRCTRCRTERWQIITTDGDVLSSQYKYAKGYQAEGLGRIVQDGRSALRLESILRVIQE